MYNIVHVLNTVSGKLPNSFANEDVNHQNYVNECPLNLKRLASYVSWLTSARDQN